MKKRFTETQIIGFLKEAHAFKGNDPSEDYRGTPKNSA